MEARRDMTLPTTKRTEIVLDGLAERTITLSSARTLLVKLVLTATPRRAHLEYLSHRCEDRGRGEREHILDLAEGSTDDEIVAMVASILALANESTLTIAERFVESQPSEIRRDEPRSRFTFDRQERAARDKGRTIHDKTFQFPRGGKREPRLPSEGRLSVGCDACGARPGVRCRANGGRAYLSHDERSELAGVPAEISPAMAEEMVAIEGGEETGRRPNVRQRLLSILHRRGLLVDVSGTALTEAGRRALEHHRGGDLR